MASRAKKKIYDFQKLKTLKRWVNSHEFSSGTKKLLRILSHDPWAQKQKIVSMKIEILGLIILQAH